MKKFSLLVVAFAMFSFVLTSCGGNTNQTEEAEPIEEMEESTEEMYEETEDAVEAEADSVADAVDEIAE